MKKIQRLIGCFLYYGFAQWLPASFLPGGKIGQWVRYHVCRLMFQRCGKNVNVEHAASFNSGRDITIGDNSGIGIRASLSGRISIGRDVMMGKDVIIMTINHRFDRTDIPMNRQDFQPEEPVVIQDDVWICDRVIILPGVCVGRGAILAAGAVVTKNVPEYAVVGGNPAKLIKSRRAQAVIQQAIKMKDHSA